MHPNQFLQYLFNYSQKFVENRYHQSLIFLIYSINLKIKKDKL